MSEFWKRKVRNLMCTLDCDKDGYISEMDYANLGRDFADAHHATPEKKDNLVSAFVNLWRKYMIAGDMEKESRLTLPVLIESLKQQRYDPELITCLVQVMRGLFELMDVENKGYLNANEHKSIFTYVGVPEGTFNEKTAFDAMDTNDDGKMYRKFMKSADIEKDSRLSAEILGHSVKQQQHDPSFVIAVINIMRAMYDLMDINQDGYLQPEEHQLLFKHLGVPEGAFDHKLAFDAIDANGDGRISIDEFIESAFEFLYSEDENNPKKFFFGPLVN